MEHASFSYIFNQLLFIVRIHWNPKEHAEEYAKNSGSKNLLEQADTAQAKPNARCVMYGLITKDAISKMDRQQVWVTLAGIATAVITE